MSRLFARYMQLLETHPLLTKGVTSGTLFMAGDGLAQYVDGTLATSGYNLERGVKGWIWGGVLFAPTAHVWYNRVLSRYVPGTDSRAVLTKVFIDQTAWALFINSAYLTYATIAINGGTLDDAKTTVTTRMWPLMKANWLLWPAVQLVNFKFVPLPLQVPFINSVVLGWSGFLALQASAGRPLKSKQGEQQQQQQQQSSTSAAKN